MMQTISFHQNNMEYNPLFLKMQERFCVGGTIAERMEKKASDYLRDNPAQTYGEYHMTHANSLPERTEKKHKRAFGARRIRFSFRHVSTACMALLVGGTMLFSGITMADLLSGGREDVAFYLTEAPQTLILDETVLAEEDTVLLSDAAESL